MQTNTWLVRVICGLTLPYNAAALTVSTFHKVALDSCSEAEIKTSMQSSAILLSREYSYTRSHYYCRDRPTILELPWAIIPEETHERRLPQILEVDGCKVFSVVEEVVTEPSQSVLASWQQDGHGRGRDTVDFTMSPRQSTDCTTDSTEQTGHDRTVPSVLRYLLWTFVLSAGITQITHKMGALIPMHADTSAHCPLSCSFAAN